MASVESLLVSMGRLLKRGWTLRAPDAEAGISLVPPDKNFQISLYLKKTSFALKANIRKVDLLDDEETDTYGLRVIEETNSENEMEVDTEEEMMDPNGDPGECGVGRQDSSTWMDKNFQWQPSFHDARVQKLPGP